MLFIKSIGGNKQGEQKTNSLQIRSDELRRWVQRAVKIWQPSGSLSTLPRPFRHLGRADSPNAKRGHPGRSL